MNGGIDIRFKADLYPNFVEFPNNFDKGEVIIELKTGKQKDKDSHQAMCYLMTHFGLNAFKNFGFVLYTDKDDLKSFLVRAVEPDLRYFLEMILHRNYYMLNSKFFLEYKE